MGYENSRYSKCEPNKILENEVWTGPACHYDFSSAMFQSTHIMRLFTSSYRFINLSTSYSGFVCHGSLSPMKIVLFFSNRYLRAWADIICEEIIYTLLDGIDIFQAFKTISRINSLNSFLFHYRKYAMLNSRFHRIEPKFFARNISIHICRFSKSDPIRTLLKDHSVPNIWTSLIVITYIVKSCVV